MIFPFITHDSQLSMRFFFVEPHWDVNLYMITMNKGRFINITPTIIWPNMFVVE
jgi:hypothetical protein